MSLVAQAHEGPFTLKIDDTTGTSSLGATVRMESISPRWGDPGRGRGQGVLPSEWTTIVEDTANRNLRDLFSGNFNVRDYEVSVSGPDGPNGNPFEWRGWVKPEQRTAPLSTARHPERLALTFYDGLTDLKGNAPVGDKSLQIIGQAFAEANGNLDTAVAFQCEHKAGSSSLFGQDDLVEVLFTDRKIRELEDYWDILTDLCNRYQCRAYQSVYDHDSNGDPRWHFMFRGSMGLEVSARVGRDTMDNASTETIASDVVQVSDSDGLLTDRGGEEIEDAVIFKAIEELPEESSNDPAATEVNATDALRDGFFEYSPDGTLPLYGAVYENVDISAVTNGVNIYQETLGDGSTEDGYWYSHKFYVGDRFPMWAELTYDAAIASNLDNPYIDVKLVALDTDGNTVESATGGAAVGGTLRVQHSERGYYQVQVESNGGDFSEASLSIYRTQRYIEEDLLTEIEYRPDRSGLLVQRPGSFLDMEVNASLDIGSPSSFAPVSDYISQVNGTSARRAGEYALRQRAELQPPGTTTLRSRLRDTILGPRTRIEYTEDDGTVSHYVIGQGRVLNCRQGSTELSDISIPDYSI